MLDDGGDRLFVHIRMIEPDVVQVLLRHGNSGSMQVWQLLTKILGSRPRVSPNTECRKVRLCSLQT